MIAATDAHGTLVHEDGPVRVTRHHTMGQTWWMERAEGPREETPEPEGWYSEPEAITAARRMVEAI